MRGSNAVPFLQNKNNVVSQVCMCVGGGKCRHKWGGGMAGWVGKNCKNQKVKFTRQNQNEYVGK